MTLSKSLLSVFRSTGCFYKLTSNRGFLKFEEFVPHEADYQTGLSYGRVSQQDELEVMHAGIRRTPGMIGHQCRVVVATAVVHILYVQRIRIGVTQESSGVCVGGLCRTSVFALRGSRKNKFVEGRGCQPNATRKLRNSRVPTHCDTPATRATVVVVPFQPVQHCVPDCFL